MIDHRAIRLELQKALTKDRFNPNLTPVQRTVTKHGTTYSQTYYVAKPKPKSANPPSSSADADSSLSSVISNYLNSPDEKFYFGGKKHSGSVPKKSASTPGYQKPTTSRKNPRKSAYPGSFSDLAAAENVLGRKGDPKGQFEIWNSKLTTAQAEAIYRYTGIFFKMMNGLARGTMKESDLSPSDVKLAKRYTDLVEQALSEYELKSDVVLHRQVDASDMLPKFQKSFASPDKLFVDEGFFSTTPMMDSFNKSNGMDLIVKVPAGKGRGAWVKHLSRFPNENEFLLNNYSMFTVDSLRQDQNGRWQAVLTWRGRMTKAN